MEQFNQDSLNNYSNSTFQPKKCQRHPRLPCDFLLLKPQFDLVCSNCLWEQQIPISQVLPLYDLFSNDGTEILLSYPPLSDSTITMKISNLKDNFENTISSINKFFEDLNSKVLICLEKAKETIKGKLIQLSQQQQNVFDTYQNIAQLNQLKESIHQINTKPDILSGILNNQIKNIKSNENKLLEQLKRYDEMKLELQFKELEDFTQPLRQLVLYLGMYSANKRMSEEEILSIQFQEQIEREELRSKFVNEKKYFQAQYDRYQNLHQGLMIQENQVNIFRNSLKSREKELQKKMFRIRNYMEMEEINVNENQTIEEEKKKFELEYLDQMNVLEQLQQDTEQTFYQQIAMIENDRAKAQEKYNQIVANLEEKYTQMLFQSYENELAYE